VKSTMEWAGLKRAVRCVSCTRNFEDGEGYCSMLFMGGDGLVREDYCTPCWDGTDQGRRAQAISHWLGRFKAEAPKQKEELIAKSAVERLLRKYLVSREPAHVNLCYILALMMERKKRLMPRDRVTEQVTGRKIIVYELAETGESLFIEDPGLHVSQAKEVQKQVKELLDQEGV